MPCHVCESRVTVEGLVRLHLIAEQTAAAPASIPLCGKHFTEAEDVLTDIKRMQTPPVHINLAGLQVGGSPR